MQVNQTDSADTIDLFEAAKLVTLCDRFIDVANELRRQAVEGSLDTSLVPRDCLERLASKCEHSDTLTVAALVSRATTFYCRNFLNADSVSPKVARAVLHGVGLLQEPRRGLAGADEERWCLR